MRRQKPWVACLTLDKVSPGTFARAQCATFFGVQLPYISSLSPVLRSITDSPMTEASSPSPALDNAEQHTPESSAVPSVPGGWATSSNAEPNNPPGAQILTASTSDRQPHSSSQPPPPESPNTHHQLKSSDAQPQRPQLLPSPSPPPSVAGRKRSKPQPRFENEKSLKQHKMVSYASATRYRPSLIVHTGHTTAAITKRAPEVLETETTQRASAHRTYYASPRSSSRDCRIQQ